MCSTEKKNNVLVLIMCLEHVYSHIHATSLNWKTIYLSNSAKKIKVNIPMLYQKTIIALCNQIEDIIFFIIIIV